MLDEQLLAQVDAFVDDVWEDVVEDIRSLVQIESVEDLDHSEPGKPWGPGPYAAMSKGLEIASRLGLEAHDLEGYIGYADLPGASPVQIATIAHTDIVPVGIGWTVPALDVTRREGFLLGRGVQDDKGPFVLSLYAAKFFVDQVVRTGRPLPYTIRCFVGCNEETMMRDVQWYLQHYEAPAFCFSPDADFPLINAEKGIFHGVFRTKEPIIGPTTGLVSFEGGTVANAIPGLATAVVSPEAAGFLLSRCTKGIESQELEDGLVRVTAHGIGGHAAFPEGTENAIGMLVRLMLDTQGEGHSRIAVPDSLLTFLNMVEVLTRATDGSVLGIQSADEVFGPLTQNAGVVRTLDDGTMTISVDVRYPRSISSETVISTFKELAERHGCTFEPGEPHDPFYMDPSLPEIQVLLDTYRDFVDPDAQPFSIGGGTYARRFPKACSFGPHDPSITYPDWVGIEHGPDEGISEEDLRRALKIYIVSIARLMELDLG